MILPPKVSAALDLLASFGPTKPIADFLRSGRIPITPDNRDPYSYAQYVQETKSIQVSPDTAQTTVEGLAAVLAHEGRHALDDANGQLIPTLQGHTEGEYRAYLENVRFWAFLYGPNGKPNPADRNESQLNTDLQMARNGTLHDRVGGLTVMQALGLMG